MGCDGMVEGRLVAWAAVSLTIRVGIATAAMACSIAIAGAFPSAARAACDEKTIFVYIDQARTGSYGTTNKMDRLNRTVDSSCYGASPDNAWSTAHLQSSTADNQAEVGWGETTSGSGSKGWHIFAEKQIGSSALMNITHTFSSCCPATAYQFRVVYLNSSNANGDPGFVLKWDDGTGWEQECVTGAPSGGCGVIDVLFNHGWPMGETGRRGSGTHANDYQRELSHRTCPGDSSSCAWNDWGDNNTSTNSITGWVHCYLTNTSYAIKQPPC